MSVIMANNCSIAIGNFVTCTGNNSISIGTPCHNVDRDLLEAYSMILSNSNEEAYTRYVEKCKSSGKLFIELPHSATYINTKTGDFYASSLLNVCLPQTNISTSPNKILMHNDTDNSKKRCGGDLENLSKKMCTSESLSNQTLIATDNSKKRQGEDLYDLSKKMRV